MRAWLPAVAIHTHPAHPGANPASGTKLNSIQAGVYSFSVETDLGAFQAAGNNFGSTELQKKTAVDSNSVTELRSHDH